MLKIIKNKENQKEKLIYNKNLQEKKREEKIESLNFSKQLFHFFRSTYKEKI